jgi:RES domain-containing protein
VRLYRLGSLARPKAAQAFSGEGALHFAGRWNSVGTRIVYASTSVALACLETLVHIRKLRHPHERWLFTVEVPDNLIDTLQQLPPDWEAQPASDGGRATGDKWIASERSAALLVPSSIVPMEHNALINPRHPAFRLEWVAKPVRFCYDPRLKG